MPNPEKRSPAVEKERLTRKAIDMIDQSLAFASEHMELTSKNDELTVNHDAVYRILDNDKFEEITVRSTSLNPDDRKIKEFAVSLVGRPDRTGEYEVSNYHLKRDEDKMGGNFIHTRLTMKDKRGHQNPSITATERNVGSLFTEAGIHGLEDIVEILGSDIVLVNHSEYEQWGLSKHSRSLLVAGTAIKAAEVEYPDWLNEDTQAKQ